MQTLVAQTLVVQAFQPPTTRVARSRPRFEKRRASDVRAVSAQTTITRECHNPQRSCLQFNSPPKTILNS